MINIGTGQDISIRELANIIREITGYTGDIIFDSTKPDGMKQKLLDVSKINALGWKAKISLEKGLALAYSNCCKRIEESLSVK